MKTVKLELFFCAILASSNSFSWENAREFTAAPIKAKKSCVVEKKPVFLNLNPHGTSKDFRVNCGGLGSRYSRQELSAITKNLIKTKVLDGDFSKLSIGRFFLSKRLFYLVSIDPAIVISVPYEFSLSQRDLGNSQMQYEGIVSHYATIRENGQKVGLDYLSGEIAENWINSVFFSSVFKNEEGAEVISELSAERVPLAVAKRDPSWPFRIFESKKFPGYVEVEARVVP